MLCENVTYSYFIQHVCLHACSGGGVAAAAAGGWTVTEIKSHMRELLCQFYDLKQQTFAS